MTPPGSLLAPKATPFLLRETTIQKVSVNGVHLADNRLLAKKTEGPRPAPHASAISTPLSAHQPMYSAVNRDDTLATGGYV